MKRNSLCRRIIRTITSATPAIINRLRFLRSCGKTNRRTIASGNCRSCNRLFSHSSHLC